MTTKQKTFKQFARNKKPVRKVVYLPNIRHYIDCKPIEEIAQYLLDLKEKHKDIEGLRLDITEDYDYGNYDVFIRPYGQRMETEEEFQERLKAEYLAYCQQREQKLKMLKKLKEELGE